MTCRVPGAIPDDPLQALLHRPNLTGNRMSIIASTARSSGASPALDRRWLAAALVLLGWIATPAIAETPPAHAHDAAAMGAPAAAPLVEKVRTATRRYLDIN